MTLKNPDAITGLMRSIEKSLALFEHKDEDQKLVTKGYNFYVVDEKMDEKMFAWSSEFSFVNNKEVCRTTKNFKLLNLTEVTDFVIKLLSLKQPYNFSALKSYASGRCHPLGHENAIDAINKFDEFKIVNNAVNVQLSQLNPNLINLVSISRWSGMIVFFSDLNTVDFRVLFDDNHKLLAWSKHVLLRSGPAEPEIFNFKTSLEEFVTEVNAISANDKYKYGYCESVSKIYQPMASLGGF